MKRTLLTILVVTFLLVPIYSASAATRNFSFDDCTWTSVADNTFLGDALTQTIDVNGGCKYLDADTKYFGPSGILTKWCTAQNTWLMSCIKTAATHHQSRSQAQSWETDRWQTSGWWG